MNAKFMLGAISAAVLAGCCCEQVPPAVPVFQVEFGSTNTVKEVFNFRDRTPSKVKQTEKGAVLEFTGVKNCKPGEKWGEDTLWGLRTVLFPVKAGAEYCVTMRMAGSVPSGYGQIVSDLRWFKADRKPIMTVDQLGRDVQLSTSVKFPVSAKGDKREAFMCSLGIVPKGAAFAEFLFRVDNPNLLPGEKVEFREWRYYEHPCGEHWSFDDVQPPKITLLNGNRLKSADEPLRFKIEDDSGIDFSTFECKVDDEEVLLSDLKRDGDEFLYQPKTPWKKDSVHGIEISVSDVNGILGYDCAFAILTDKKAAHRACSLRDDGMMLLDGKPFFPLGIFNVHPNPGNGENVEKDVKTMVENGMNVAHTYMVRGRYDAKHDAKYDSLVAACEKYGMLLYSEPSNRNLEMKTRSQRIAENVLRGNGYKEMFGWGIGDDTSINTSPDALKRLHRFCKAIDPGALTVSADVIKTPQQQADYIPFADVLLLETYPIRQPEVQPDEMARAAEAIDNAWAAVDIAGVKGTSVMALPQCFKGWSSWKRYPTKDEIRAQAYIALCCRARGLIWYTAYSYKNNEGPFNNPQHLREFCEVTREIAAIMPSLVTRDAVRQPRVTVVKGKGKNPRGSDAVRALLKEDGLLLVANTSQLPVTAEIELPDGRKLVRDLSAYGAFTTR